MSRTAARNARAAHKELCHRTYIKCKHTALRYMLDNPIADVATIRDQVQWPETVSPRILGAVFNSLRRDGAIKRKRVNVSVGENGHSHALDVWELNDRSIALALLGDHTVPEPVSICRIAGEPVRSAPAPTNISFALPAIEIDEVNNQVRYDNRWYRITKRGIKLLAILRAAGGEWVPMYKASISKASEIIKSLPPDLANLVESSRGKGSRLKHLAQ